MRSLLKICILLLSLSTIAFVQVPEGERLFVMHCSSCHTVGKGKLVGPDLLNITVKRDIRWLRKFIRSSQSLIQEGDTAAVALYNKYNQIQMPDPVILSDVQIDTILSYIRRVSTASGKPDVPPTGRKIKEENNRENSKSTVKTMPDEARKGRELFDGSVMFSAGGSPCISCHHVNDDRQTGGGMLAPDLTNVFSRIDDEAIIALVTSPRYTSMQKAYEKNPVTLNEAGLIAAYLRFVDTRTDYQRKQNQRSADLLHRFRQSKDP